MSSDDAGALVRKALQLSHQAADEAIEFNRAAERDLDRSRTVPDEEIQVAAQAALGSSRNGEEATRGAIVAADRANRAVSEQAETALEEAQGALKLAIRARKLLRRVASESEAVRLSLAAWEKAKEPPEES